MKIYLYALMGFLVIGLSACRKSTDNLTIAQFDQAAITNYIQQNGLTGMHPLPGDTSGIYYQIIKQGTGAIIDYPDPISISYTTRSFDGAYSATDTITNHLYNYLGHIAPTGLQYALKNIIKQKGTIARILIPSRLAYGLSGAGSGTNIINGNQGIDYTINLIDDINKYDDLCIRSYMKANGINVNDYTAESVAGYPGSRYYYKVTTPGTGTVSNVISSVDSIQYTGTLLNGTIFDQQTSNIEVSLYDLIPGFQKGLTHVTAGGQISLFIPSVLGYGNITTSGGTTSITSFSCLRFEVTVSTITN